MWCLERWNGVLDQHLEVSLVPSTSLRRWLERIVLSAERVIAVGAGVRGTVRLATGLDPDEGVDEAGASGASRADTEAGTVDVAPVTPLLAETGDTVAASVDDSLGWHAGALELGGEEGNVLLLVLGLVPLGIGGLGELSWRQVEGVPASNVGGDTTDALGRTSILVYGGELLGSGLEVVVPAEPASVASIDVHGDVGQVKLLESIGNTLTVACGGVLAGLLVAVGNQVGERIGLDNESNTRVGVLLEESDNG